MATQNWWISSNPVPADRSGNRSSSYTPLSPFFMPHLTLSEYNLIVKRGETQETSWKGKKCTFWPKLPVSRLSLARRHGKPQPFRSEGPPDAVGRSGGPEAWLLTGSWLPSTSPETERRPDGGWSRGLEWVPGWLALHIPRGDFTPAHRDAFLDTRLATWTYLKPRWKPDY